ncbi:MAG: RNA polymerase sigma factor [Planctomycetota bacterium]
MLAKFPGRSRRKWYDPDDAFSDVTLKAYRKALQGDLRSPPDQDNWREFIREGMRKKLWEERRKDSRIISGKEAMEALAKVEAGQEYDPARSLEAREELEVLVPKVNEILSPKQGVVFFAAAQELSPKEAAEAAQTTPGAARVFISKAQKKLDAKLRPRRAGKKPGRKKEVA